MSCPCGTRHWECPCVKDNRSEYTKGFQRGMTQARLSMIRFLDDFVDQESPWTAAELRTELYKWLDEDDRVGLTDYKTGDRICSC